MIVSPDKPELGLSDGEAESRRTWFEHKLTQLGYSFKRAYGSFNGKREVSYIVLVEDEGAEHALFRLAKAFQQDAVLIVDANGYAALFDSDGQYLANKGQFVEVSQEIAQAAESYTFANDHYYVALGA
jgi:hypothetical protein